MRRLGVGKFSDAFPLIDPDEKSGWRKSKSDQEDAASRPSDLRSLANFNVSWLFPLHDHHVYVCVYNCVYLSRWRNGAIKRKESNFRKSLRRLKFFEVKMIMDFERDTFAWHSIYFNRSLRSGLFSHAKTFIILIFHV